MSTLSDAALVLRCLEGDTDAFGELVGRYESSVYATAYYYVGRYGAAEDVSQEAFWAAYRGLRRLKDPNKIGPWLREDLYARVQRAIDTLPERYRLPVMLRYLQELSYEEISRFTGESRDEIRGILHRAARQLRTVLSEDGNQEEESTWPRVRK
jgi:RNA polymerase sigma-70 factor (ECF subfamily)